MYIAQSSHELFTHCKLVNQFLPRPHIFFAQAPFDYFAVFRLQVKMAIHLHRRPFPFELKKSTLIKVNYRLVVPKNRYFAKIAHYLEDESRATDNFDGYIAEAGTF